MKKQAFLFFDVYPELNSRWGTICTPAEMPAPDGIKRKTYKI